MVCVRPVAAHMTKKNLYHLQKRFLDVIRLLFCWHGGLILIIFREAKYSGVHLTLQTPLLCVWWSLFEIWLSDRVYWSIAKELSGI